MNGMNTDLEHIVRNTLAVDSQIDQVELKFVFPRVTQLDSAAFWACTIVMKPVGRRKSVKHTGTGRIVNEAVRVALEQLP